MSHTRYKSRRPKNKARHKIKPETKELIIQLKAMGLTYNQIVEKTTIGYATCEYIVTKWAPNNPEVVKIARAKALEELASKVNEKAILALEHITPDSLTHDRIVHKDAEGNVTGVSHSGPTGQQIAITAGVLLDKSAALEQKAAQLRGIDQTTLGPSNVTSLLESIKGRVKRLTEINANLDLSQINAKIVEFEDAGVLLTDSDEDDGYLPADYEVVADGDG